MKVPPGYSQPIYQPPQIQLPIEIRNIVTKAQQGRISMQEFNYFMQYDSTNPVGNLMKSLIFAAVNKG